MEDWNLYLRKSINSGKEFEGISHLRVFGTILNWQ
jgi:hypothetical protein